MRAVISEVPDTAIIHPLNTEIARAIHGPGCRGSVRVNTIRKRRRKVPLSAMGTIYPHDEGMADRMGA